MFTVVSIVTCFVGGTFLADFGAWAAEEKSGYTGPRIEVPERRAHFGNVFENEEQSHVFKFKNIGDQPLEILKISTSCSCLFGALSIRTLQPGEEGSVTIGIKRDQRPGSKSAELFMVTNDPLNELIQFNIDLEAPAHVEVDPKQLNFGRVHPGDAVHSAFDVKLYRNPEEARVLSVGSTIPGLQVQVISSTEEEWGTIVTYEIAGELAVEDTDIRGSIRVETDSLEVPIVEIPIVAEMIWSVSTKPSRALFGAIKEGTTAEKTVTILSTGSDIEFPIKASCIDPRINVSLKRNKEDQSWRMTIRLMPSNTQLRFNANVHILGADDRLLGIVPVHALVMPGDSGN